MSSVSNCRHRLAPISAIACLLAGATLAGTGHLTRDGDTTRIDLLVSVRFEADDEQLARIEGAILTAGSTLARATDGHLRLGEVAVLDGAAAGPEADLWILPGPGPSYAFGALGEPDEHVLLHYDSAIAPDDTDPRRLAGLLLQLSGLPGLDPDRDAAPASDLRLVPLSEDRRAVVVLDGSASMSAASGGLSRRRLAQRAAGLLLDLLPAGTSGSVLIGGGERPETLAPWGALGGIGRGILEPMAAFVPRGEGRFDRTILRARELLASPGRSAHQSLLLITDGSPGIPDEPSGVAALLGPWTPATVIDVGSHGSTTRLATLARRTGGRYWRMDDPAQAARSLPYVGADLGGRSVLAAVERPLEPHETLRLPIRVDAATRELAIVLGSGGATVKLTAPDGRAPHTTTTAGPGYEILRVTSRSDLPPGPWLLEVARHGDDRGPLRLTVLTDAPSFALALASSRPAYRRGEPIVLRATPQFRGQPVTGARVQGRLTGPGGTSTTLQLLDDGDPAHADEHAADGVYTARIDPAASGTFVFEITVESTGGRTYAGEDPVPPFQRWRMLHVPLGAGVPGDCDGDADIDLGDFESFSGCFGLGPLPECACADLDGDLDVDCTDWDQLRATWNGEGAPPGFTPCDAGTIAGTLTIGKPTPTGVDLQLSWSPSCAPGPVDYAVYEGLIGSWYSHSPVTCATPALSTVVLPAPGDRYYLVAPHNLEVEGSYGKRVDASGPSERPAGTPACAAPQVLGCEGDCRADRCHGHGECLTDAAGGVLACDCDFGWTGGDCRECYPSFTGPDCAICAAGYVDNDARCDACALGYHAEHRLAGAELRDDGNYDDGPAPYFQHDLYCMPDESCANVTCAPTGSCVEAAGIARCVCDGGYTGTQCDECAAIYEPGPAGGCVLGQQCRDEFCYGHGDCFFDALGDLTCNCDAGFGSDDCGGPEIVVQGTDVSIGQGEQITLAATGGSGAYLWTLESGPGSLTGGLGTPDATYHADFSSPDIEIPLIRITDSASGAFALTPITVIPFDCLPISGLGRPELVWFDRMMCRFMKSRGIRAGTLAVAKDGVLTYSRGYGLMNPGFDDDPWVHYDGEAGQQVPHNALMRMASLSKPLADAAVRQAAADAGIGLDEPALPFIETAMGGPLPWSGGPEPIFVETQGIPAEITNQCPDWPSSMPDSRWGDITFDDLIHHTAGISRDANRSARWTAGSGPLEFIPPGWPADESYNATSTGPFSKGVMMIHDMEKEIPGIHTIDGPVGPDKLIQYMAGHCLLYDPGTDETYSNFGHVLLGRVLEGLNGVQFAPEPIGTPTRPVGFGPYVDLLVDFLNGEGISDVFGGASSFGDQQAREPYYRHAEANGDEFLRFNIAQPFFFDETNDPQNDLPAVIFSGSTHVSIPYGGWPMASWDSAAGLIASAPGYIRFMKEFWVSNSGGEADLGKRIVNRDSGWASHSGLASGTRALAWQMGKPSSCYDDNIGEPCSVGCEAQNFCQFESGTCQRQLCVDDGDCPEAASRCVGVCSAGSVNAGDPCKGNPDCPGGSCGGRMCHWCKNGCTADIDSPGSQCVTKLVLPKPEQMWNQEDVGKSTIDDDPFYCVYDPQIDVVVMFNQSRDGKDTAQDQYNKINDFLKRAACTVGDWPGPIPPCPDPPCLQWK